MLFASPLFFGFLAAVGALIAELFVFSFFIQDPSAQSAQAINTNFVFATGGLLFLFLSAFIEECFKYLLLKKTLLSSNSLRQLILFILFFTIGFSSLEIALIISDNAALGSAIIAHIIGVFLLHLTTISLFGSIINHQSLGKLAWLCIPVATLIHFLYNIVVLYQDTLHI